MNQHDGRIEVTVSRALEALLGLVLPADRREEFLGDLCEEANRRAPRFGRAAAVVWMWLQALQSLPALVVLRVRRLGRPPAGLRAPGPVAPLAREEVQGAFAAFLGASRGRRRRPLPLALSVVFHAGLAALAIRLTAWQVDEVQPPMVLAKFWAPRVAVAAPAPRPQQPQAPKPRARPPVARARPATPAPMSPPSSPSVPVTISGDDKPTIATTIVRDDGCPPGQPCPQPPERREVPAVPPRVGQKACVDCPDPHVPGAILPPGGSVTMLVKICVDQRGLVSGLQVLRGIEPAVDAMVKRTLEGWRYSPYRIDEHPVPFCYVTRFQFSAE
jgi:hypothetical protein